MTLPLQTNPPTPTPPPKLALLIALWSRSTATNEISLTQLTTDTSIPLQNLPKLLDALHANGCLLERSPNGIRLISTPLSAWSDLLEHHARSQNLALGRRIVVFAKTSSTNDIAWSFAPHPPEHSHGLVVLANEQSAGRGRLGNPWYAKSNQSLLFSMLLRDLPNDSTIDQLTLLAGLATAKAIESALAQSYPASPIPQIQIKWPNDLLLNGRKLAGILVERKNLKPASSDAVLGIGINVAQTAEDFPAELATRATSIYAATGLLLDRPRLAAALLTHLNALFPITFNGDWISEWKARCPMIGTRISAHVKGQQTFLTGQVIDISPLQGMILRDDLGVTHFLSAATITLTP